MRWLKFTLLMVLAAALAVAPLTRAFAMTVPADDAGASHCGSMGETDPDSDGDDESCSQLCSWACSMGHGLSQPSLPLIVVAQPDGMLVAPTIPITRLWPKAPIRPPIS